MALDWQRIALRTIYTEGASPIPSGSLYLGFTSLAVNDAVRTSLRRGPASGARRSHASASRRSHASAQSAAVVAAHDVLVEYFPASAANLDSDLVSSLSAIPDGRAKTTGIRIGRAAAARMIASRVGDGRNDTSIVYRRDPAPGVWQPPATGMLVPWLGFVDRLMLHQLVAVYGSGPLTGPEYVADFALSVDGPDRLTSPEYAADFDETRRLGSATSTERTAEQTETARFFNANAVVQYRDALLRHLDTSDLSLARTTRLFAGIDAATADGLIQCWRLKYDYGFWRPSQAIAGADIDGNPATAADPAWTPLLPNPPYPEYPSGHACVTSAFVGAVRPVFGDDLPLLLRSTVTGTERLYPTLTDIEHDAFHARIRLGIHFRDGMDDGYRIGHRTARRVVSQLAASPR